MESAQRYELIAGALRERERVEVAELAELTGCSEMTIRRDLDVLERDGLLRRVRGGAVSTLSGEEAPYGVRTRQRVDAKQRIGKAVGELLDDGESVVIDAGTTTLEVARAVAGRRLTVLPLSLHIANAVSEVQGTKLVLPGGEVRPRELTFHGPLTLHAFDRMRFDTVVLGICGVTAEDGVTAYDLADAETKAGAIRASTRVIAATDSAKLGRIAFGRVCPVSDLDVLVTDRDAPSDQLDRFREAGVEVHLA
ncbi:DeoR/GlpR family DNA-binding transcription regulator [Allokutzneria oryzae]|uniref:DeoR/GlpR family DNA-binding transcription regulator n=1 Tax=Allokutzneria oryzae TaxID=1378989 RepID=A0ABV5ZR91_9PSEU